MGEVIGLGRAKTLVEQHMEAARRCEDLSADYDAKTACILRRFAMVLRARAATLAEADGQPARELALVG